MSSTRLSTLSSSRFTKIKCKVFKRFLSIFSVNENKIAVLIDGDNAESSLIKEVLSKANQFGKVTVKRIYGDWTNPQMKSWKGTLNEFGMRPVQKFEYTLSKGSTDTALIIDAMDLLHSKVVTGFCIVSSDSDYTGLAHRVREEGFQIIGIGRKITPIAFVRACDTFIYTETLLKNNGISLSNDETVAKSNEVDSGSKPSGVLELKHNQITGKMKEMVPIKKLSRSDRGKVLEAFQTAVMCYNPGHIDVSINNFCMTLRLIDNTLNQKKYGYSTFRKFVDERLNNFETFMKNDMCYVRLKNASALNMIDPDPTLINGERIESSGNLFDTDNNLSMTEITDTDTNNVVNDTDNLITGMDTDNLVKDRDDLINDANTDNMVMDSDNLIMDADNLIMGNAVIDSSVRSSTIENPLPIYESPNIDTNDIVLVPNGAFMKITKASEVTMNINDMKKTINLKIIHSAFQNPVKEIGVLNQRMRVLDPSLNYRDYGVEKFVQFIQVYLTDYEVSFSDHGGRCDVHRRVNGLIATSIRRDMDTNIVTVSSTLKCTVGENKDKIFVQTIDLNLMQEAFQRSATDRILKCTLTSCESVFKIANILEFEMEVKRSYPSLYIELHSRCNTFQQFIQTFVLDYEVYSGRNVGKFVIMKQYGFVPTEICTDFDTDIIHISYCSIATILDKYAAMHMINSMTDTNKTSNVEIILAIDDYQLQE